MAHTLSIMGPLAPRRGNPDNLPCPPSRCEIASRLRRWRATCWTVRPGRLLWGRVAYTGREPWWGLGQAGHRGGRRCASRDGSGVRRSRQARPTEPVG